MKPLLTIGLITATLAGCATTSGVMSVGPDTFLVSSAADIFRGGGAGARQNALSDASKHCTQLGKELLVTNMATSPFVGGGQSFEVTFRCLAKGDAELGRPTFKKTPNIIIENRQK